MKKIPLSEVEDDLTREDYRLEHDASFLDRVEQARADISAGKGIRIEDLPE